MKQREPGVRKAGGELIKTNLNYGSKNDDVHDVYIFFSLGLGIVEQPRTVPTTPGRLLFGSELFRNTKPVTNLNQAKSLHSMGKL